MGMRPGASWQSVTAPRLPTRLDLLPGVGPSSSKCTARPAVPGPDSETDSSVPGTNTLLRPVQISPSWLSPGCCVLILAKRR